jgi:hypothetical protein
MNAELHYATEQLERFEETVEKVNPDIMLLDSFLTYNHLLLRKRRPVILLQTMLSTVQDSTAPPLTSFIVPNGSFLNRLRIRFAWFSYFFRTSTERMLFLGDSSLGITKRIARRRGIDLKGRMSRNRTFQVGLTRTLEVVLSPRHFDFPGRQLSGYQLYTGMCTQAFTLAGEIDPDYSALIHSISNRVTVVYCSLGTLAEIHCRRVGTFYQKLIDAFRDLPDLCLIVSVGSFDRGQLQNIPGNVHLFRKVPQPLLLRRACAMITHGGLNSVLECIACGKPMLVYPLNSVWDQPGNAARVVYHKLGLSGDIRKVSSKDIILKVSELLNNASFRRNAEVFKDALWQDQIHTGTIEKMLTIAKTIKNSYAPGD